MANESVTESQHPARCKHNVEMVNGVNERLLKARAIVDLMMTVEAHQLASDTVSNAGWAILTLLEEAKDLVNETEAQA